MKKLTYERVKNDADKIGYELLSEKIENAHAKIKMKCDKGHVYNPTWNNFKKGSRCPYCSGVIKHTYKAVKNNIEKDREYKLLSRKYTGVNDKLKLQCPNGNIWYVSYKYWKGGVRRCNCLECCDLKNNWRSHIYIHEEVNNIVEGRGFKLKSKYRGTSKKINIDCPNGHNINVLFGNFAKGHGCKYCADDNLRRYDKLSLWERYSKTCRHTSSKIYRKNKYLINPNGLKTSRHEFHIDHIYSICDGYKNKIPPYIISSVPNLQLLWCSENTLKHTKSWMTKEELFDKYFNYFEEQNDIKDTL